MGVFHIDDGERVVQQGSLTALLFLTSKEHWKSGVGVVYKQHRALEALEAVVGILQSILTEIDRDGSARSSRHPYTLTVRNVRKRCFF